MRSYDLTLTRYDFPEPLPSPESPYLAHPPKDPDTFLHTFQPSGPLAHLPPCQYRITLPSTPIGPSSLLPVALALRLPAPANAPPLALHSVSVVLERRMDFYEASGTQSAPELLSGTATTTPEASPAPSRTSFRSTASTVATHSPSSSLSNVTLTGFGVGRKRSAGAPPPAVLPAKSLPSTIATAESTLGGSVRRSSSGSSRAELTIDLAVPPRPPPSQWPLGETMRTDLASIAFYVRVKVAVVAQSRSKSRSRSPHRATPSSSSSAAPTVYEYELPEREVQVVYVTEEERASTLARIAERRSRSGANSRRASMGATDANPMLSAEAGAAAGAEVVPPLPKGASTIKFGLEDALKGGVSAAMLNSRLKNVKASREAVATRLTVGPPPAIGVSGPPTSCSGSSACSSVPSTASSYSPSVSPSGQNAQNHHNSIIHNYTSNVPRKTRSKTPVGTARRPQTTSGAPPSAHNNKAAQAPVRRTQSGQAAYHRPQSEVASPHELDAARQHGVFLAPDWVERDGWRVGGNSSRRSSQGAGSKSDSEAKVRARKDRSPTACDATPTPTTPPVPGKDRAPTPPHRTVPPSPSRPIPPPPSSFPNVHRQPPSPSTPAVDVWEGEKEPDEMPNPPSPSFSSLSPSSSRPASVSSHGQAQIPSASLSPGARSSPNLLDPTSADSRGRDTQRRPRGNSNVSSRSTKGFFSSLLSAKA